MHVLADFVAQFSPLLLSALAAYIVAATVPVVLAHLKVKSAQAQQLISDLLTGLIQRGEVFANSEVQTTLVPRIARATTGNHTVDKIMDYAVAQSPDLLKKAGIDVTTTTGQQALARRIVATLSPKPE